MAKYIAKRLLYGLITLLGITIIDFILMNLVGNPIDILASNPKVSEGALKVRAHELGLDRPAWQQYFIWIGQILHGNFGFSYKTYQPVSQMILSHLFPTLILMGTALAVSMVIAVVFGIYSAVHVHTKRDYSIVFLAFLGQSVPGFFLALVLIYFFSVRLGWLPSSGMRNLNDPGDGVQLRYLILPATVLALSEAGNNIRYIRSAMLEILNQDYLRTVKGKGVGRRILIYRHALRNALIPIVTVFGMEIPGLFGGSVILEQIFSWPGLGLMTMNAILQRDYPVIMATCLLSAVVVLLANIVTDILYAVVDPTVKLGKQF